MTGGDAKAMMAEGLEHVGFHVDPNGVFVRGGSRVFVGNRLLTVERDGVMVSMFLDDVLSVEVDSDGMKVTGASFGVFVKAQED